jgi:hypothetical protein
MLRCLFVFSFLISIQQVGNADEASETAPRQSLRPIVRPNVPITATSSPFVNNDCPPSQPRRYVGQQICYDESIFRDVTIDTRRDMLRRLAPLAVYLQEVTGYPASVIIANLAQEQGWSGRAPGNNLYGIICISRQGEQRFHTPLGLELTYNFAGCTHRGNGGAQLYQDYASPVDSMLGYINLLLYRENTARAYRHIRDQVPNRFPPPANADQVITRIGDSPYCQSACTCNNGKWRYTTCMRSHISAACLSELDGMTLCDYNLPQLGDLPPLFTDIEPSSEFGKGSRRSALGGATGSESTLYLQEGVRQ